MYLVVTVYAFSNDIIVNAAVTSLLLEVRKLPKLQDVAYLEGSLNQGLTVVRLGYIYQGVIRGGGGLSSPPPSYQFMYEYMNGQNITVTLHDLLYETNR